MKLFTRSYSLNLAGLLITGDSTTKNPGLQIEFKVEKTPDDKPNTADITVSNLSPDSRAKLVQKQNPVIRLDAGYNNGTDLIFVGKSRTVTPGRSGTEMNTVIACGDGEIEMAATRINKCFAPGITFKDVIKELAASTGLDVSNIVTTFESKGNKAGLIQLAKGFAAKGKPMDKIIDFSKAINVSVSVQDGVLTALEDVETTKEDAIVLSESTGLVESPAAGDKGIIKARSLLQGGLRIGRRVKLVSIGFNGFFKVVKVTHTGNYRGQEWYSDVEMRPL